ncbi:protein kinase superfamily protein [Actinidia rufa]|uniref:Protein kinase superfamily protein n=1 Tax=Actinidia rufa TaxID=165716 RepID=A0A7J0FYF2_9ERIC|nr:protein kinase superfamily protein [Actinidia rufa]
MLTRPRLYPQAQILARYECMFEAKSAYKTATFLDCSSDDLNLLIWGIKIHVRGDFVWSKYLVSSGAAIKGGGEEAWSADMSQLLIGNKFASGRHSRIYRGVYKKRDVAIKLISQPEEDRDLADLVEKQFTSEVASLFRLHHPNIITIMQFVAACKKNPVFCIITEYLAGGSLRKYLHQQEPYSLPLNIVLKLALDIAHGMQYLHSQGILHRDLKSENLLLGEDMHVKIADFGISCLESQCGSAKGFTGTYRWMAPEMIKEKRHTKKVDVYSFGIVLWELLTALTPFDNMTPEQAAFAVCHKNARPPLPSSCPVAFGHLINRCWSSNPNKRPHFKEIVSILDSYAASLEQDPEFFFRPSNLLMVVLFCDAYRSVLMPVNRLL